MWQGHEGRLGRVAFHPMGRHVATASFDETWRLWDVETCSCLLEQEGHSRSVYTVAFHPDGSLAASGGLDAIGQLPLLPKHCHFPASLHQSNKALRLVPPPPKKKGGNSTDWVFWRVGG